MQSILGVKPRDSPIKCVHRSQFDTIILFKAEGLEDRQALNEQVNLIALLDV